MNVVDKDAVRFVGRMREWSCPTCGAMLTGLEVPGPDERSCNDCRPVPADAPSLGALDIGAHGAAELWTRRALRYVEAKEWGMAESCAANAIAAIRVASEAARRGW